MRFRVSTVLLSVAIIALVCALFIAIRNQRVVIVRAGFWGPTDSWVVPKHLVQISKWVDKNKPPPVPPQEAFATGEAFCSYMNERMDGTGFSQWKIDRVSLEKLSDEESEPWAILLCFTVVESAEHSGDGIDWTHPHEIMVLMDKSLLIDTRYWNESYANIAAEYPGIIDCSPTESEAMTATTAWEEFMGFFNMGG